MASSNHRAALLSNLRTGGVRGASIPQQPHSAAPTTTRFQTHDDASASDQELLAMMNNLQMAQLANGGGSLTAGMDGNLRLQQIQMMQMMQQAQAYNNAQLMYTGGGITHEQAQAAQLQLQRMQAMHAQQQQEFQAQLLLQQQLLVQRQLQQGNAPVRRASAVQPSTAGPLQSEFDPNSLSPAQTRSSVAAQLRARAIGRESNLVNSIPTDDQPVPMSATPSGRFNTRAASLGVGSGLNPNAATFVGRFSPTPESINPLLRAPDAEALPQTPSWGSTTVISGGTSLGAMLNGRESGSNSGTTTPSQSYNGFPGHNSGTASPVAPLKSDTAISWRRGSAVATPSNSNGNLSSSLSSPPSRSGSASPPARRSSPLSSARLSPPAPRNVLSVNPNVPPTESGPSPPKSRPSPLQLKTPSPVLLAKDDETTIELESDNDQEAIEELGSGSASNKSSPTSSSTPPSSADSHGIAREEASKRLYEGLGLGRPVASPVNSSFGMAISGPSNVPQAPSNNAQTSRLLPVGMNAAGAGVSNSSAAQVASQQAIMNAYGAGLFSPAPSGAFPLHAFVSQAQPQQRIVSEQPRGTSVSVTRQPRGPPAGVDELGSRNFATRSRRKAFGGVAAVLEGAAERREAASEVVAF